MNVIVVGVTEEYGCHNWLADFRPLLMAAEILVHQFFAETDDPVAVSVWAGQGGIVAAAIDPHYLAELLPYLGAYTLRRRPDLDPGRRLEVVDGVVGDRHRLLPLRAICLP